MPKRAPTKILPPVEYLRERLDYTPETGELRWKNGKRAGAVILDGRYRVHRVIWKWMTGEEPPDSIDHADRNDRNNRWDNLRVATPTDQVRNRQRPRGSTNPYCGVYQSSKGSWIARIRISYKMHNLGSFPSPEEAAAAYEVAARKTHGVFYNPK
jgi:hypothetical protein